MEKIVFYTLTTLVLTASAAPEGKPSPIYLPPDNSFVADQPIYSPDTSVAVSPSNPKQPTTASNVGTNVDNTQLYNTGGYVDGYNGYSSYDPGYGLQTGYEGYLVPTGYYSELLPAESGPLGYLWSLIPASTTVLAVVGKGLAYVAALAAVVLTGAVVVFGICTFTSLCHIKIHGINPITIKEEVRSFMTPDNISTAVRFLREAINKYQKMQN